MTEVEKIQFVEDLISNVKEKVLSKIPNTPDEWDGLELRWLIRDHFNTVVWGDALDKRKSRYRQYQNETIVKNLL